MAERKHKLHFSKALRMGLSIKNPVRFCLTVLLTTVAFAMTGLALLAACYDESEAMLHTYVQFCDSLSLYSKSNMTYDSVKELSAEWGLPCGVIAAQSAYPAESLEGNDVYQYVTKYHVHATAQIEKIACYDEAFMDAEGIKLLAGKKTLSGNEVIVSECFAHFLLAFDYAENAEGLIGMEIPLHFGEDEMVTLAGVYRNDDCYYAQQYAGGEMTFITTDACRGETYTGALFVSGDLFSRLAGQVDVGYFAGDHDPATGEKVRDYFQAHSECRSELFMPLVEFRKTSGKITGAFGAVGGALAAFSALMIFQFINISIDGKRQMIGILRALGGRSTDVVKIFLIESGFLGLLSGALALSLAAGLVPFCNELISSAFGMNIAILSYHPLVLIGILVMSVAVSLLSALFPVLREARKRPVDVIKFAEE